MSERNVRSCSCLRHPAPSTCPELPRGVPEWIRYMLKRQSPLVWRRANARGGGSARTGGKSARCVRLRAVGGVAFEAVVGLLVDAGGGTGSPATRPPLAGTLRWFQPALQLAFLAALLPAFLPALLPTRLDASFQEFRLPSDRSSPTTSRLPPRSFESTATPRPHFRPRAPTHRSTLFVSSGSSSAAASHCSNSRTRSASTPARRLRSTALHGGRARTVGD